MNTPSSHRASVLAQGHKAFSEKGENLMLCAHFVERLQLRAPNATEANIALDVALRAVGARLDRKVTIAVQVGNHVFMFDNTVPGRCNAVTYWFTSKPPSDLLQRATLVLTTP